MSIRPVLLCIDHRRVILVITETGIQKNLNFSSSCLKSLILNIFLHSEQDTFMMIIVSSWCLWQEAHIPPRFWCETLWSPMHGRQTEHRGLWWLKLSVFVVFAEVHRREDSVRCPTTHLCHRWQGLSEHATHQHQPVLHRQWRVRGRSVSQRNVEAVIFLFANIVCLWICGSF